MTRLAIRRLAFAALFLPGAWAPALALPPLSLEDVFSIEYASDPRIGPEGDRIVYVRNSMDPKTDRVRGSTCRRRRGRAPPPRPTPPTSGSRP